MIKPDRGGRRSTRLDVVKGFAIILMVIGHSRAPFISWIYLFHMPVFFMTSGYFWKDSNADTWRQTWDYIRKKTKGIYVPFALANSIFSLFSNLFIRLNIYTDNEYIFHLIGNNNITLVQLMNVYEIVIQVIKSFLFVGSTQMGGALWFLSQLFLLSVGHCCLICLLKATGFDKFKKWIMLAVFFCCIVLSYYVNKEDGLTPINTINIAFANYMMYLLGMFVRKYEDEHLYSISFMILSFGLLCVLDRFGGIKNLLFKKFFFATLGGTVGAAIIGITMAYLGFGVWALVAQQLFNTTIDTIILWITVKWRPDKRFSFQRLKVLFSFGWKLLASGLLDTIYTNVRALIIGKLYTSEDLAYYNQGEKWPNVIIMNINNSIDSVLLPTMSKEQDDVMHVKSMTRRAITISTYIMAPLMLGLAVVAKNLVSLILTEKWLPCVFFLQIFCVTYIFQPIHTANLNAIKALGRSDIFLKLEIMKKIVGILILLISLNFGVKAVAIGSLIAGVLAQIINSWPNKKLLNYSYISQITDILPNIIQATCMGIVVYFVSLLMLDDFITLLIQIPLGAFIYLMLSILTKNESFNYLLSIIRSILKKKKRNLKS